MRQHSIRQSGTRASWPCSTWASGDTPDTAARKGALAKKLSLGGVMFWELSQDAFQGKQYPLIRAAAKAANS